MSELKKYECTVLIDASCGVTVEASSPEEAAELAENAAAEQGAGSLCHQCSNHTECGDSYAVIVYEDDKEILDTDHRSKLLADAQSQLAALREELAKFDEGMRALACSLGAGGYNAETLTADELVGKVQWGIDNIITVQEQRLADAERRNSDVTRERDFLLEQFREMAQAQPYAMVDHVRGPYQCTPGLDTYKWFWWNGAARPIYKGALCDVVLSDGSIHFDVPPDFNWNDCDGLHVIAARHGPNLDYMERVDRPAPRIYAALNPNPEAASHDE